jgi:hypothetical protein
MPHEFGNSSEQLNYHLQREQKAIISVIFYSLAMAGKESTMAAYCWRLYRT